MRIDRIVSRLDSVVGAGSPGNAMPDMEAIGRITDFREESNPEAPESAAQQALEEAKAAFVLTEGYQIELFAYEVDFPIANPVEINFADRGRMLVTRTPTYPTYFPGNLPSTRLVHLSEKDQ